MNMNITVLFLCFLTKDIKIMFFQVLNTIQLSHNAFIWHPWPKKHTYWYQNHVYMSISCWIIDNFVILPVFGGHLGFTQGRHAIFDVYPKKLFFSIYIHNFASFKLVTSTELWKNKSNTPPLHSRWLNHRVFFALIWCKQRALWQGEHRRLNNSCLIADPVDIRSKKKMLSKAKLTWYSDHCITKKLPFTTYSSFDTLAMPQTLAKKVNVGGE